MPTYTELAPVYGVDGELPDARNKPSRQAHSDTLYFCAANVGNPKAQERYAWLTDGFKERFGSAPTLFARAPGKMDK